MTNIVAGLILGLSQIAVASENLTIENTVVTDSAPEPESIPSPIQFEQQILKLTNLDLTRLAFDAKESVSPSFGPSSRFFRLDLATDQLHLVVIDKNGQRKIKETFCPPAGIVKTVKATLNKGLCVTPRLNNKSISCLEVARQPYVRVGLPTMGINLGGKANSCAATRDLCGSAKNELPKMLETLRKNHASYRCVWAKPD